MNTQRKPTIITRILSCTSNILWNIGTHLTYKSRLLNEYIDRREWNATSDELYNKWVDESIDSWADYVIRDDVPFRDYVVGGDR